MRIDVSQTRLIAAIHCITPVISTRTVIPILSGIKLHADPSSLILSSANSSAMIQYDMSSDNENLIIHQSGSVVIPSHYFGDIIRNMPPGLIEISVNDGYRVCIRSGKAQYSLNGLDPDEFPQMVKQEDCASFLLNNHHLMQIIKRVAFTASASETRPVLTGVACEMKDEKLRFVASDGIRLSLQTTDQYTAKNFDEGNQVVIPGKHLSDFSKVLADDQASTDIMIGKSAITFKTGRVTLQASLIDGTFPSVDRITPNSFTSELIVRTENLLHAYERVALMSGDTKVVKLRIKSIDSIELSASTEEIGDVREEIDIEKLHGNQWTIVLNGRYIIDILRAIDCKELIIRFTDQGKPIVIQPVDNPYSLFLITPVRTRESN